MIYIRDTGFPGHSQMHVLSSVGKEELFIDIRKGYVMLWQIFKS